MQIKRRRIDGGDDIINSILKPSTTCHRRQSVRISSKKDLFSRHSARSARSVHGSVKKRREAKPVLNALAVSFASHAHCASNRYLAMHSVHREWHCTPTATCTPSPHALPSAAAALEPRQAATAGQGSFHTTRVA